MDQSRTSAYIQHLLDAAKRYGDTAGIRVPWPYPCVAPDCERNFRDLARLQEHAEAVHTFDDIRRLVSEAVREAYNKEGDYKASPSIPGVWTWVEDLSTDWLVFSREEGTESGLYKVSYSIVDSSVQLGEPVEVHRRTVYEPVNKES